MARRRNLSSRHWQPEEIDLLRGMAATGVTMERAAAVLGRAHCAVACKAMREGIRFHGTGRRSEPKEERLNRNAVVGSAMLKEAILRAASRRLKTLDVGSSRRRESR